MTPRLRLVFAAVLAVAWVIVTLIREFYFKDLTLPWWGLMLVALACGFTSGCQVGIASVQRERR